MKASTLLKLAGVLCTVLGVLGAAAEKLPPGKLKYALVVGGMIGTSGPALWARIPSVYQQPPGHPVAAAQLQPGDVLLYRPVGIYGLVIWAKTWHPIAHVEVYVGDGRSVASRDGLGTGVYPLRLSELAVVCRPHVPIDVAGALARFEKKPHRPYGWLDLAQFIGIDVNSGGIVCSPCADEFLRDAGLTNLLNGEPAAKVAPFEFEVDDEFVLYDVQPDGTLKARAGSEVAHA